MKQKSGTAELDTPRIRGYWAGVFNLGSGPPEGIKAKCAASGVDFGHWCAEYKAGHDEHANKGDVMPYTYKRDIKGGNHE